MKSKLLTKVPSLYQLITVDIFHRDHDMTQTLPLRVGNFKLEGSMRKSGTTNAFLLGNYINKRSGKAAIGKLWSGKHKDYFYYSLKNEINIYILLHSVLKREANHLPKELKNMVLPEIVTVVEEKGSLMLLLEFKDGKIANDFSLTKRLSTYWNAVNYISFLGSQMTPVELAYVPHRSALSLVCLYPLLVGSAILAHPKYTKTILAGIPVFAKSIPALLTSVEYGLIHRDLHFKNILISKTQNTLLDLQYCAYSLKLYDLVTTLRYRWGEDELYKKLLSQIYEKYKNSTNFKSLFRGLSVLSATHGLTGRMFTKKKIGYWADFLTFANNYSL